MDELTKWIELARAGDDNAFAKIVEKYEKLLFKMSNDFSKSCPESLRDGEDLLQEAKIALYNAVKTYDFSKGITFGAYAKTCIKNSLISCIRKMKSKKRKRLDEASSGGQDTVSTATISKEQKAQILRIAKMHLSYLEYKVFEMYYSGLRASEISKRLGKDVKSVNNAIYRMKSKLSRVVEENT